MLTMYQMIKVLIGVLSVLGYGAAYKRLRLPTCFFPVTLVAGVSLTLYGFGFFSALKIGSYAIILVGLALLLMNRKRLRSFLMDPSILLCLVAGVWLFCITRGAMLSHWDDGSHWYRICKSIYVESAFPTTPDILYYNYVPGCQLWVYFVLQFIEFTIPDLLFAQGLINIACVATLFAGAEKAKTRKEKGFALAVIAVADVTLCAMDIGTYVLMVDLQLGLTAMALLILLLDQGAKRHALIPAMLISVFLLLVKNSAVFFLLAVFLWAAAYQHWRGKKLAACVALLVLIPLLLRGAYAVRMNMVYADAAASPQSMSLDRFAQMLSLKDADSMKIFTERFLYKFIIGDTALPIAVYVSFFLLAVFFFGLRREDRLDAAAGVRVNLIAGAIMTVTYALMLYLTYVFTMNVNEMISVNSFYRYYGSMVIVLAGSTIYMGLNAVLRERLGGGEGRLYASALLLFAVIGMSGAYPRRYIWGQNRFSGPDYYEPQFWQTMVYHIPQNRVYSGQHYVLLWNPEDYYDGYVLNNLGASYHVGAWLRSEKVDAISLDDLEEGLSQEQMDALSSCDQLVLMSDMTPYAQMLEPYLEKAGLSVEHLTKGLVSAERESGAN